MTPIASKKAQKSSTPVVENMIPQLIKIPLVRNNKIPVAKGWTDPVKREKMRIYPYNNIGILTGSQSGITVIDIDLKNGTMERFLKEVEKHGHPSPMFQETPSGGLHYFFRLAVGLTNRTYDGVDVRNNGGYVVFAPSMIDGKSYKLYGEEFLKALPEIPKWLLTFIATNKANSTHELFKPIVKTPKKSTKKAEICLTEKLIRKVLNGIPMNRWDDFSDWLKITCAMKSAESKYPFVKKLWDEYSGNSDYYHEENNMKIWDSITNPIVDIVYLNELTDSPVKFKYYKPYQAIDPNCVRELIHQQYLTHKLYDTHATTIVKSATGTGKTVSVAKYLVGSGMNYISITSRISLVEAQIDAFSKYGLTPVEYRTHPAGCVIPPQFITTIDSLRKFDYREDAPPYVLLLDEFSSLLNYLITSDTMNTHRKWTYKLFLRVLKNATKVIAIDADMNDASIAFLKKHREDVVFIENTYQNAKGIKAYEYATKNELIDLMMKEIKQDKPFVACFDSKDDAEVSFMRLKTAFEDKADRFILHTADSDEDLTNIQEKWMNKFVFYSPKVVYGVDYVPKTPLKVFLMAKTHTISPLNMAQQVARCRNIESLHYFINDTSHYPKYRDRNEAKKSIMADFAEYRENFENMGLLDDEDKINENNDYLEWFNYAVYDADTFSVCPKKHFEEILQLKGFELVMGKANEKVKLNTKDMRFLVRNEKEEKYTKAIENPEEVDKEYVRKLTERWDILNMNTPKERMNVIWVANDPHQFSEHMRIRHLIDGDDKATDRLKSTGEADFAVRIPKSEAYKLNMLKKLCGEGHPLVAMKEEDKETPHGISEEVLNEFKKLFRLKFSHEEVKTWGELEQKRLKAMKQQDMFWGCVEIEKEAERKQVDGVRIKKTTTTYSLNEDRINNHLDLIAKKHGADLKDPYKVFEMYGVEPVKYEFREDEEDYDSELEDC